MIKNYKQTVEAEIKIFMRLQRACVGGNRAEMQFIKWTAEGTFKGICTMPSIM